MAIEGGLPLRGEAEIHGAKNAVLPVLSAALLCPRSVIRNCPMLSDVRAACRILERLGCSVTSGEESLSVDASCARGCGVPASLAGEMRSSIIFLGALLARFGKAQIALPGGCRLGPRPIDLHISGLRRMGARIIEQEDGLICSADKGLKGADISLAYPSVGATENLLIAASLAKGETILRGAAQEPEIDGLIDFLNLAGARLCREGSMIRAEGVRELHDVDYTIIPDRIEAATYLSAAAATGGEITLKRVCTSHLASILPVFREMGCRVEDSGEKVSLSAPRRLLPVSFVSTSPYPGFPTDALAPIMAASLLANGESRFEEGVFESRYLHVEQFRDMGADVRLDGKRAYVKGKPCLYASRLHCTDLRGGAALAVAALAAQGVSLLDELQHIHRGYEDMPAMLRRLGGRVWTLSSSLVRKDISPERGERAAITGFGLAPVPRIQGVL